MKDRYVDEIVLDSDARAGVYMGMYNNEIKRLKAQYNQMYEVTRDIFPATNYLGRIGGR